MLICCWHGVALAGGQQEQATDLLADVVEQLKHQTYQASGVYIRPSGMLTFDIDRAGLYEKVTEHGDLMRYTANTPFKQLTVYPNLSKGIQRQGRIDFQALVFLNDHLTEGLKHYRLISELKPTQLAGRMVRRLSITSRTKDRYSYVYWVDVQTSVVLRFDIVDEKKALIERMVFTSYSPLQQLQLGASADEMVGFDWVKQTFKPVLSSQFEVSWLPAGFSLYSVEVIDGDDEAARCERLILTDGFAEVEVYSCKSDLVVTLTRGQQLDALHQVKYHLSDKELSIEGRLPMGVLLKIAENIELKHD